MASGGMGDVLSGILSHMLRAENCRRMMQPVQAVSRGAAA
ncbi:hypothetical protein ACNKHW_27235 [Shigella flexneri]